MEAKDTIIDISYASRDDIIRDIDRILEAQANNSFSKGIKEGKRKMVKWLEKHRETYWQQPNGEVYMITRCKWTEEEWQALKKETNDG